jgi:hypothetical protein
MLLDCYTVISKIDIILIRLVPVMFCCMMILIVQFMFDVPLFVVDVLLKLVVSCSVMYLCISISREGRGGRASYHFICIAVMS